MSGIVGCIGKADIPGLLIQGLNRLEYLGYDSAGLALIQNGNLRYKKLSGTVRLLTSRVAQAGFSGEMGIAGLRFATHGGPTRANAPPQLGCKGQVAVVHSGLIENHIDVKKPLLASGHKFRSKTDTEILAHLVEGRLSGTGFLEIFIEILDLLDGSFSFLVIDRQRPDEIFGACAETEMWVGSGKGFTIISSGLAPLIAHSRQAVRVEPDSIVRVRNDRIEIYGKDGKPRDSRPEDIGLTLAQAQRGGYPFFTLKEIHEQAISIRRAYSYRTGDRGVRLRNFGLSRRALRECDIVRAIGSGSSFHAALVAKNYIEELVRIPAASMPSSELLSGAPVVSEQSLLIAFSQSGKTRDTLEAARMWRRRGGRVMVISNTPGSPLWKEADGALGTHAGPEIGMVATKTFTASLVTSYLFAITLGLAKNAIKRVPERELIYGMERLPEVVDSILQREDEIENLAGFFLDSDSVFFTGFGMNFAPTLEGALKMKQLASIHAEGIPVGEIKHQVLGMVGPTTPVIALVMNHQGYEPILGAVREIKKAGGVVIVITTEGEGEIVDLADATLTLPSVTELLSPIPVAVVLQRLAAAIAQKRGFDLDAPRNLRRYFE